MCGCVGVCVCVCADRQYDTARLCARVQERNLLCACIMHCVSVYIHTQIIKLTFVQRTSNHAKQSVMADFLDFIDANSQPNGRQSGSYSTQIFFHPKFTRIAPPKQGEKNYDEKARSFLVHEFNRVQGEMRKVPVVQQRVAQEAPPQSRPPP